MKQGKSLIRKRSFVRNLKPYFCISLMFFVLSALEIQLNGLAIAAPGGEQSKTAIPVSGTAKASITPDKTRVVFTAPDGTVVELISIRNKEKSYIDRSSGKVHIVTTDRVNISNDGSHVGIYTIVTEEPIDAGNAKSLWIETFRYYDVSGLLWQKSAPEGTSFFLPTGTSKKKLTTYDGSRVLLISSGEGDTNPNISVYDQKGKALYESSRSLVELDEAQISPAGRNILVRGLAEKGTEVEAIIKVIDIDNKSSFDFRYDPRNGIQNLIVNPEGKFEFEYLGEKIVLPK